MSAAPKQTKGRSDTQPPFDAAALVQRYAVLDECPEGILDDVITLPIGSLVERVRGVCIWRDALLNGRLPPQDAWPPAEIGGPVRGALERLGIARFCEGQAELVDDLLGDVLEALRRGHAAVGAKLARRVQDLEEIERTRLRERRERQRKADAERKDGQSQPVQLDEQTVLRLRAQAEQHVADSLPAGDGRGHAALSELAQRTQELEDEERARRRPFPELVQTLDTSPERRKSYSEPVLLDEQTLRRLRDRAERDVADGLSKADQRGHEALREVARRIRELEKLERDRLKSLREPAPKMGVSSQPRKRPQPVRLDEQTLQRLRRQAEREIAAGLPDADAELMGVWSERVRFWTEIASVFGDLGEMLGRGWDLSLGILRHTGWRDALRLGALVERLPELRELVRALGRLQDADATDSVAERVFIPMRRLEEERREVRTPLVPADTRGVERSGSVARMLPAEAAMLGHPRLRMLWHARRSERALLTYRVEGVEFEHVLVEQETTEESQVRQPKRERGPILAVIDSSGSMHGLPETVAKALVLEALRTAHAEKRQCRVYAFSGPGQALEHELALSFDGVAALLNFLGHTFGGGSDPTEAMTRVLSQLRSDEWARADVLLVSDGEWPAQPRLKDAVQSARTKGVRFHGIQIGNRGRTGLHEICEPVHVFTDWVDLLGEE